MRLYARGFVGLEEVCSSVVEQQYKSRKSVVICAQKLYDSVKVWHHAIEELHQYCKIVVICS